MIGSDGSVHFPAIDAVQSLTARELKPKQHADLDGSFAVASPAVFQYKDRELVVSVCSISRLCASESQTSPIVQPGGGIWGSLSTWQDTDGTRWILAPVTGPLHSDLKVPTTNGPAPNGSVVAFQLQEQGGKVTLSPAWVSRDMPSPLPPVIANGVVFVVSAGEFTRQIKRQDGITTVDERPKGSTHATLYALDARTTGHNFFLEMSRRIDGNADDASPSARWRGSTWRTCTCTGTCGSTERQRFRRRARFCVRAVQRRQAASVEYFNRR